MKTKKQTAEIEFLKLYKIIDSSDGLPRTKANKIAKLLQRHGYTVIKPAEKPITKKRNTFSNRIRAKNFLEKIVIGLKPFPKSGRILFGEKRNDVLFEYNKKDEILYVMRDKMWNTLKINYRLHNNEVRKLIHRHVVTPLKLTVSSIWIK